MDQNEIDRIAQGIADGATFESKPASAPATQQAESEPKTEMIEQLDKVTQVAEQETNKVLQRMESILGNLGSQAELLEQVKEKMGRKENAEVFCSQLDQCLQLGQQSQDLIFDAMSLLQFQDIIRQKLEKLATKLEDLLEFIDTTVGRDASGSKKKRAHSLTIERAGLVPDGNKNAVDAILAEHLAGGK
jgi:SPX domain protein involved in polyphosphate accumulation